MAKEQKDLRENEENHRRFYLVRGADESGISGTGRVLDGVMFPDGTVVVHWRTPMWSVTFFPDFETFNTLHNLSHPENKTELVWLDKK